MDPHIFWNVIGEYNSQTIIIQIGLFIFLIFAIAVSYIPKINWSAKFAFGITNLFIGIGFSHYMEQNPFKNILLCHYTYFTECYFCMKVGTAEVMFFRT